MADCPDNLYYSNTHEWVCLEKDDLVTVGITQHAQTLMGDLVYIELPELSRELTQGEEVMVIESVKTAADIYSPLNGTVIKVNEKLSSQPELVNQDPYGEGWLFQIESSNAKEDIQTLLSADEYAEQIDHTTK